MNISKQLLAAAALVVSFSATAGAQLNAPVLTGGPIGPIQTLTGVSGATCTAATCLVGTIGTITGGTFYSGTDLIFSDNPGPDAAPVPYISAGPVTGNPATLTFNGAGLTNINFLFGSPDLFNSLTVNFTGGSTVFTPGTLGFGVTNGNQDAFQYVTFSTFGSARITSLVFSSSSSSFEAANFSTSTVPEPSTYALMGAGLLAMGFVARRRRTA